VGRPVENFRAAGPDLADALDRAHRRGLEFRCVLAEESDTAPGRTIGDTAPGRKVARIERTLAGALQAEPDPAAQLRLREQATAEIEPLLPPSESRRVKLGEAAT
jgi:hypothetical protein